MEAPTPPREPSSSARSSLDVVVGALALASLGVTIASAVGEQAAASWAGWARSLGLVLLVPLALWIPLRVTARGIVLASACGAASLLLWAFAGTVVPWSWEPAWLALSAAWWSGIALPLRRAGWGAVAWLTLVLGIASALDAVVTAWEGRIPETLVFLLGGWKLPLALVWTGWVGARLATRRVPGSRTPGRPRP